MEEELINPNVIPRATEASHQSKVEPAVVFVHRLVDLVEISTN